MPDIVDLSQKIYDDHPVFPTHVKTKIFEYETYEDMRSLGFENPFHAEAFLMSSHGPTHVDGLNEFAPPDSDLMSIEEVPLDWVYGPGICLDVSHVEPNTWMGPEELEDALDESGLEIPEGGTVLLYWDHYERTHPLANPDASRELTDEYLNRYPGVGVEAAEWLGERGVKNVGVDAPSIDKGDDMTGKAHIAFIEQEMLNTENLCNLGEVVNEEFTYCGLPLRFGHDFTGAPIRAVAIRE